MVIHWSDGRGADSHRYRNRAEITVVICEQKPCPVWFLRQKKGIRYSMNPYLIWGSVQPPKWSRPRNDPQPWNDPQIDSEMIPISLHVDPEMIPN